MKNETEKREKPEEKPLAPIKVIIAPVITTCEGMTESKGW